MPSRHPFHLVELSDRQVSLYLYPNNGGKAFRQVYFRRDPTAEEDSDNLESLL